MPGALHRIPPHGRAVWRVAAPAIRRFASHRWDLTVERTAPLPTGGFVYTGNHPSSLDPVLVGAVHGRPIPFLAVDELLGKHRSLDLALRWFGTVPVARRGVPLRALRITLDHLRAGGVLGVFPEGTRAPVWGATEPRPGAAWLATKSGTPLVPVAMIGTEQAFTMDLRFGRAQVRMIIGPPLHPRGTDRPAVLELHARWKTWMDGVMVSKV